MKNKHDCRENIYDKFVRRIPITVKETLFKDTFNVSCIADINYYLQLSDNNLQNFVRR